MIELILVGSGKRVYRDFYPILKYLNHKKKIKLKAIVNRTKENSDNMIKEFKCAYYKNLDELFINNETCMNIILSINQSIKDNYVLKLLKKNYNVFIDTPPSHKIKFLNSLSYFKSKITFAEDQILNPIVLEFQKLIKENKENNFEFINNNFTTSYHFFSILKSFFGKNFLNCNLVSKFQNNNLIDDDVYYGEVKIKSLTEVNRNLYNKNKQLIFFDINKKKITSNEIMNEVIHKLENEKDDLYLFLKDYIKNKENYEDYQLERSRKILKLIGLKNMIDNWCNSFIINEKILFSTESATETLIFLKTTSISRKLNIKLNPSKLKLIKYFL